jgi:hypothetical protein
MDHKDPERGDLHTLLPILPVVHEEAARGARRFVLEILGDVLVALDKQTVRDGPPPAYCGQDNSNVGRMLLRVLASLDSGVPWRNVRNDQIEKMLFDTKRGFEDRARERDADGYYEE